MVTTKSLQSKAAFSTTRRKSTKSVRERVQVDSHHPKEVMRL